MGHLASASSRHASCGGYIDGDCALQWGAASPQLQHDGSLDVVQVFLKCITRLDYNMYTNPHFGCMTQRALVAVHCSVFNRWRIERFIRVQ